jgi:hypothetical protein
MADSGLIAIEKLVERLGKTHKQRYWVKPAEVREMVKKGKASLAITKLGGDPVRMRQLVDQWTMSPGSRGTATMRAACVAAIHGSKPDMIQRELDRSVRATTSALATGEFEAMGRTEGRVVQDTTAAFKKGLEDTEVRKGVAALAAVSQSMYEQPHVELWRGIRGNSSNAYLYDKAYNAIQKDPDAEIILSTGVLSSFTENPEVAQNFASMSSAAGEEGEGFYFKVKVPRDSIVMSHRVKNWNPGQAPEQEVTVLTSGSIRIKARDIMQAMDKPGHGLAKIAGKEVGGKPAPMASTGYTGMSIEDYAAQYLVHKKKWG